MNTIPSFSIAILLFVLSAPICAQQIPPDQIPAENGPITIQPIRHATLVLSWDGNTI